jgi:hypothetical protein
MCPWDCFAIGLPDTITRFVETAAKLNGSGARNEADTKVLLIEPMVGSLATSTWSDGSECQAVIVCRSTTF